VDAFISGIYRGSIIEEKQDSCDHLKDEQKKTDPPEIIPDGMSMLGNFLLLSESSEFRDFETIIKVRDEIIV